MYRMIQVVLKRIQFIFIFSILYSPAVFLFLPPLRSFLLFVFSSHFFLYNIPPFPYLPVSPFPFAIQSHLLPPTFTTATPT